MFFKTTTDKSGWEVAEPAPVFGDTVLINLRGRKKKKGKKKSTNQSKWDGLIIRKTSSNSQHLMNAKMTKTVAQKTNTQFFF